jgi:hypothetical protein
MQPQKKSDLTLPYATPRSFGVSGTPLARFRVPLWLRLCVYGVSAGVVWFWARGVWGEAERSTADVQGENARLIEYAQASAEAKRKAADSALRQRLDLMRAQAERDMVGKSDTEKKLIRLRYEKAALDLLDSPNARP